MNNTSLWPPKFASPRMGFFPVLVLLSAMFLFEMFLMQRHGDSMRDSPAMLASEMMKPAPEVRASPLFSPADDQYPATQALFTSPPLPSRTFGRAVAIIVHAEPPPSMDVVGPLQLHFEHGAMGEGALSEQKMNDLLAAKDLPLRIGEYTAESRADPDAKALTSLYLQVVERAMTVSGTRARLGGFACGIRICVGVLSDGNDQDYWNWRDAFSLNPELSNSGLQAVIMSSEGDRPTLRFTFSVDPYLIATE